MVHQRERRALAGRGWVADGQRCATQLEDCPRNSNSSMDAAVADGFVLINDFLQSDGGPPNVFAAGDIAASRTHPRPKAGVFAVRAVR